MPAPSVRSDAQRAGGAHLSTNGRNMRRTLSLPDGRYITTSSTKRWHVLSEHPNDPATIVRVTSSDTRSRALARWRVHARHDPSWLIDADTGEHLRTPDHEAYLP